MKSRRRIVDDSLSIRTWQSEYLGRYLAETGPTARFWQPKYYSFEIYSQEKLREKLNYIHENPVRRGLVARAEDWKWCSARWYALGRSVGAPIQWVE